MDILDDMGVSKLSAKVFFKVNYSFNNIFRIQDSFILDFMFIKKLISSFKFEKYLKYRNTMWN